MFTDTWHAILRALEGLAEPAHPAPAYFVIPMERAESSLRPGSPIPVSSAPAAIEAAGWMQSTYAGALAIAWAGDGPMVLARYGETGGQGDELK